jgi:hypothetical protein
MIIKPETTANRFVGQNHFPHRIPLTQCKTKGHFPQRSRMCIDGNKCNTRQTEAKYITVYCKTWDLGLCLGECFKRYHSKANYCDYEKYKKKKLNSMA